MSKPTAGPWRGERDPFNEGTQICGQLEEHPHKAPSIPTLRTPRSRIVARLPGNDEEGLANARLIAAAPDLLAACEAVLTFTIKSRQPRMTLEQAQIGGAALTKIVRDAIAKATEKDKPPADFPGCGICGKF